MVNKAIMNDSIIKSSFLRQVIASFPPPVNLTTASCASHKKLVPTCLFIALLSVRAAESKLVLLTLQLLLYEINHSPKAERHMVTIIHSLKRHIKVCYFKSYSYSIVTY